MVSNTKPLIAVFTGAGISAESGLQTFRGAGGLWEGYRVEEVATPEAFQRNPELVLRFYNERRRKIREALPNPAHYALAQLEKRFQVVIVTQNIDDLHERAGSSHVIHIHGEIFKARCTGPCQHILPWEGDMHLNDKCPRGYPLRPHVVWFGEPVLYFHEAQQWFSRADCVLVVGTSLVVYPAALLPFMAPFSTPIYIVDPGTPEIPPSVVHRIHHIAKKASEGVPELVNLWMEKGLPDNRSTPHTKL